MLWLCISLPRLPLESLAPELSTAAEPLVITFTAGRSRRIVVANAAAEGLGLETGMDYATAEAAHPNLRAIERTACAEVAALERLATWAYQWSSFVTFQAADATTLDEHSLLWVEIGGSCNLFGGREPLLAAFETALRDLGYSSRLGISCTLEGAALLARAGKRIITLTPQALLRQADKIPVGFLALPPAVRHALQKSGVRHIGAVLRLPADAIARRFGPDTSMYLQRLTGQSPDPRPGFELPKQYRGRCYLGADVSNAQALLFPIRRLLGELQGYLRAIDAGIQQFSLLFEHHRQQSTRIEIGASTPTRDLERLFNLTRERLENFSLPMPTQELCLQADRFMPAAAAQNDFFKGAIHNDEQLQQVLEKIAARLGTEAVRTVRLVADHRPERAWRYSVNGAAALKVKERFDLTAARPLWLLPEPQALGTMPETLAQSPVPSVAYERIESRWSQDPPVQRDYYTTEAADGSRLWVFRDGTTGRWYLHGLWS